MCHIARYPTTLLLIFLSATLVMESCKKDNKEELSDKKEITSFKFLKIDNPALAADIIAAIGADTITASVSGNIDITTLKPAIVHVGKSISPNVDVNRDFSKGITYQVTAEDGTTHVYFVKVSREKLPVNKTNRVIYFGDDEHYLYALDAITGKEIWKTKVWNATRKAPLLYKGTLYVQHLWGVFTALDAATGIQKWQTSPGENIGLGSLIYNDELFAVWSENIYKLDIATGFVKWRMFPYNTNFSHRGSPTIAHGNLYIDSVRHMMAIDLTNGTTKWKKELSINFITTNPLATDNSLYVSSVGNYFYSLNPNTGEVVWKIFLQTDCSPAIDNGTIYVAGQSEIYKLEWYMCAIDDAHGTFKWKTLTGNSLTTAPAIANGMVYYGSLDNNLYAFDAVTGEVKWKFYTGGIHEATPTVANDIVYIGSLDKKMYALDARTGDKIWEYMAYDQIFGSPTIIDAAGKVYYPAASGMKN